MSSLSVVDLCALVYLLDLCKSSQSLLTQFPFTEMDNLLTQAQLFIYLFFK